MRHGFGWFVVGQKDIQGHIVVDVGVHHLVFVVGPTQKQLEWRFAARPVFLHGRHADRTSRIGQEYIRTGWGTFDRQQDRGSFDLR